jgi:uncharacterized protein (DUF1810 family)
MATATSSSAAASASAPTAQVDTFDLSRFLDAQDNVEYGGGTTYTEAMKELRRGRKSSHWIWFVFPQISGLARFPSRMASHFAISSAAEARAYLEHPVLGARLREGMGIIAESRAKTVEGLMGSSVDAIKLRSCVTLFWVVSKDKGEEGREDAVLFKRVLDRWFDGKADEKTVQALEAQGGGDAE